MMRKIHLLILVGVVAVLSKLLEDPPRVSRLHFDCTYPHTFDCGCEIASHNNPIGSLIYCAAEQDVITDLVMPSPPLEFRIIAQGRQLLAEVRNREGKTAVFRNGQCWSDWHTVNERFPSGPVWQSLHRSPSRRLIAKASWGPSKQLWLYDDGWVRRWIDSNVTQGRLDVSSMLELRCLLFSGRFVSQRGGTMALELIPDDLERCEILTTSDPQSELAQVLAIAWSEILHPGATDQPPT
jgi:hypothetical protein